MKPVSNLLKWGLFFSSAVIFALSAHWLRQRPPTPIDHGWAFQVVKSLDQAGDLYNALQALPRALADPNSKVAARKFQAAIGLRKAKAPTALHEINDEINGTERRYKIPRLIFRKGVIAELQQDDQKAIHWFQKAIEMKPTMSIAHVRLGLIYERLGEIKNAESSFIKALNIDQQAPLSHFHYGLFLARSTQSISKALASAEFLQDIRPIYAKIIREKVEQKETLSLNK